MNRSKLVAIATGTISLILAIAYLILVQFLDFRGEMQPAPQDLSLYRPIPSVLAATPSLLEGGDTNSEAMAQ
ncbi:hypothetical protein AY599_18915 [Leptolyngbya valderiana BDU 20041]|nr:hypothetical protein [Geitlerinema sp. CS-897]OAB61098.1 hypothetical protein AY599_18915 [Leptolyngbya valderiana BDU 20041]PPT09778.1 hypothetical protein CKA32_006610 [Geitlerinema sp. FC II]